MVKLRFTAGGETENTNAGAGVHLSHCVSSTHWLTCLPFFLFEYELVQKPVVVKVRILLIDIRKT